MTKSEFLEALTAQLNRKKIPDTAEIVDEYREHFACSLADGYTEEEIAAKLGDPCTIAAQYDTIPATSKRGKKAIAITTLCTADFSFGILCVLLYTCGIVLGALTLSFAALCIGLLTNIRLFGVSFTPQLPYSCAVTLGIASAALAALCGIGTFYFFPSIRRLMRSFGRFHQNVLARASGRPMPPDAPAASPFTPKQRRRLRNLTILFAAIFIVFAVAGFLACARSAEQIEFWHAWGWFGYGE